MKKNLSAGVWRGLSDRSALFLLAFFLFPSVSRGVPANPAPVYVSQPDGSRIRIVLRGDEFYKWHEDDKGYTILRDTSTKEWTYAERGAGGRLRPGKYKVGAHDPSKLGFAKRLADPVRVSGARLRRAKRDAVSVLSASGARLSATGARLPALTGTMKNLVILAEFPDLPHTYTQAQFNSLFNQTGYTVDGAVGSVRDYYSEVSYNKLTVQSTVSGWVTLPHPFSYYGANDLSGNDEKPQEMVADAVNALAATGFNFASVDGNGDGEIDGLDIIHSGRGEETGANNPDYIWSHEWNMAAPIVKNGVRMQMYHTEPEVRGEDSNAGTWGLTRVGVICHETGHFLGLPDLYDTTYASAGAGDFCLMASGSWNGPGSDGRSPAHMSAWCKKTLGWASASQPSTSGSYSLRRVEDHSNALYLLSAPVFPSTEYFLAENRQGYGFDAYLPGSARGMLIWHVDESRLDNNDPTHYLVDLEEADGVQNLEQSSLATGTDADYFRQGNNTAFGDDTNPKSRSYAGTGLGMSISGISATGDPMTFSLGGVEAALASLRSMDRLKAYPNPCYFSRSVLHIDGIPPDPAPEIYIYSAAGELVRTLNRGDGIDSFNNAVWNGKDKTGAKAASGLYLYLARTADSGNATGKFYIFW
ncbi:MAG: M6 family metalloprotease domain-containing protein [Elusimicrobiales bacterium]|jgi:immune inhibitor A